MASSELSMGLLELYRKVWGRSYVMSSCPEFSSDMEEIMPAADVKSTVIHLIAVTASRCLPAAAEVLYSGWLLSLVITLCTSMLPLYSPTARMLPC